MRCRPEAADRGWLKHPFFLPREFRCWLADQGSLTHRLRLRCHDFGVRPVRVGFLAPNRDERDLLGLRAGQIAYTREVVLNCNGQAVVFAHSVVADISLRGPWAAVANLGSRPLGEALFSNPRVARGDLQFRRVSGRHPLARQARKAGLSLPDQVLWARRSLFTLEGHPLLVTELFLPAILSIDCKRP